MSQLKYKQIFDISPEVSSETAVFPGDQGFSRQVVLDCNKGDHLSLSSITTTVHIGAHADAPNHYQAGAIGIDKQSLDFYLGPCTVIDVASAAGNYIQIEDIPQLSQVCKKVLFKTGSYPDPKQWDGKFQGLSPELIEHLASLGVKTVGIDTPSIDIASSKDLPAHQMVAKNKMAILEGIVLSEVEAGEYYLVALPLKLKGCDASPVRAILLR